MPVTLVNRLLIVLAAIGLFITTTLVYAHLNSTMVPCGAGNQCEALFMRAESKFMGQPLAYYGFAGYAILLALAAARAYAWPKYGVLATKLGLYVSGFGFAASLYLVYMLTQKLQMTCMWCFASAITMTLTFVLHLALQKAKAPEGEPAMLDAVLVPFALAGAIGLAVANLQGQPVYQPPIQPEVGALAYEKLVPSKSYIDGPGTGRVTLVEIADFYCPQCRAMAPIVRSIKDTYGDRINIAYRTLPLFQLPGHENAMNAALAGEYARLNGKYYEFIHAMYSQGAELQLRSDITLAELLDKLGLDGNEWKANYQDMNSQMFLDLDQGMKVFAEAEINVTPTFVVYIDKKDPVVLDAPRLQAVLTSSPYRELLEKK